MCLCCGFGGFLSLLFLECLGFLLEMRAQRLGRQGTLFFADFACGAAVEVETRAGALQRLQVAGRLRVQAQRAAQQFAADVRQAGDHLLVDADRQWLAFVDDLKLLLELLEHASCRLGRRYSVYGVCHDLQKEMERALW